MDKKIILLTIAIISLVVLSGCGQKTVTEKMLEGNLEDSLGQNVDVDLDNGAVRIEGEDGSTFEVNEGGVSLPADFPEDVYVVEGTIISAMKNVMGQGHQITISNKKSVAEIKAEYEEELVKEGWEVNQSIATGGMVMLGATKDGRNVSISASVDPDDDTNTMVVLNVMDAVN